MSLATGYTWQHDGIRLLGFSLAGITTSIVFPDADVVFDLGQGFPWQMNIGNILLTHGHLDHASGLAYVIGQKSMQGQTKPKIYLPPVLMQPMTALMKIWEQVEDHTYNYEFIPVQLDQTYPLKGNYFFRPFQTHHRVPSFGYTVFERKKQLKAQFRTCSREELIELRQKRIEIEEFHELPLVSFTGDTKIEYLDTCHWVANSKVLLTEVTFIDRAKPIENARHWGHIHLEELIPRLEKLKCEKVVLIHLSARYTTKYIRDVLEDRLPEHVKTRVEIFPRPI